MTDQTEHQTAGAPGGAVPDGGSHSAPGALLTKNESAGNTLRGSLPIPGRGGIPTNAIVHGACGAWWTGNERSHCGGCHETYSSLTAFDKHRRGGICLPAAVVGLVARQKPYGVLWGNPAPEGGYGALRQSTGPSGEDFTAPPAAVSVAGESGSTT